MVIKVMLLGFLGGNMIYAVIAFLMGDMQYIPEVLTKTGVCLVIHTILLLGVTALEHIENRNWRIKNRVGTDLGSEYKTLKCSAAYYMIYVCTFLLTLMLIALLYLWYQDERETLIESYHNGGLTSLCSFSKFLINKVLPFIFSQIGKQCPGIYPAHFCLLGKMPQSPRAADKPQSHANAFYQFTFSSLNLPHIDE